MGRRPMRSWRKNGESLPKEKHKPAIHPSPHDPRPHTFAARSRARLMLSDRLLLGCSMISAVPACTHGLSASILHAHTAHVMPYNIPLCLPLCRLRKARARAFCCKSSAVCKRSSAAARPQLSCSCSTQTNALATVQQLQRACTVASACNLLLTHTVVAPAVSVVAFIKVLLFCICVRVHRCAVVAQSRQALSRDGTL